MNQNGNERSVLNYIRLSGVPYQQHYSLLICLLVRSVKICKCNTDKYFVALQLSNLSPFLIFPINQLLLFDKEKCHVSRKNIKLHYTFESIHVMGPSLQQLTKLLYTLLQQYLSSWSHLNRGLCNNVTLKFQSLY